MKYIALILFICLASSTKLKSGAFTQAPSVKDECLTCHSGLGGKLQKPADAYIQDIHYKVGITCANCHGGDPTTDDMEKGMSKQAGFIGVPKKSAIPTLCGKCHSDAGYMKRYNPRLSTDELEKYRSSVHARENIKRDGNIAQCVTCHGVHDIVPINDPGSRVYPTNIVKVCSECHSNANLMKTYNPGLPIDQFEKYKTSVHGKRILSDDSRVASCASCHSSHDIRPANDPKSSVYVVNIPQTCARCHSDAQYMRGYRIPTDQYSKFVKSVHGKALLEKHDTGAPSCNKCHGNHGAVPPGVKSISNVCGTCHSLNADLFASSPHKKEFDEKKIPECDICHGNHEVEPPTDDMLGVGPKATCTKCHQPNDQSKGYATAAEMRALIDSLKSMNDYANKVVTEAEQKGMEVSDARFALNDVRQALIELRTMVHSFDIEKFKVPSNKGFEIVMQCIKTGESAIEDYYFRRIGLGISTLIISVLALGLYLKIRKIEKKR